MSASAPAAATAAATATSDENAARDDKLRALLQVMVARVPAGKRITTGVVQQLLRAKYSEDYPADYVASREAFITTTLEQLMQQRPTPSAPAAVTTSNAAAKRNEHSSSDEDESSDASDDEEEDEAEDDDDDEDESDEDDDDDDESASTEVTSVEAASRKRAREEMEQAFGGTTTAEDAPQRETMSNTNTTNKHKEDGGHEALAGRCKAMVSCLQKLGYRPRLPEKDASLQDYLEGYLKPEFVRRKLDPTRYTAQDIRRYKALKEVEQLQQDGAVLQLDRRQRVGRGYANVALHGTNEENGRAEGDNSSKDESKAGVTKAAYTTPKFLDDDDE